MEPVRKEIKDMDNSTKDMLCNLYEFIDRWNGSRDDIDFTATGILKAKIILSNGINPNEAFINRFLLELDVIKKLSENRPTKTFELTKKRYKMVESTELKKDHSGKEYAIKVSTKVEDEPEITIRTFKYYDEEKMEDVISIGTRYYDNSKEITQIIE